MSLGILLFQVGTALVTFFIGIGIGQRAGLQEAQDRVVDLTYWMSEEDAETFVRLASQAHNQKSRSTGKDIK